MRIVRKIAELDLDRSRSIGLVPTMGAFHEGHLSLMRRARSETDIAVVSLFVNPTQFGPGEDFERYPRNEQEDAAMAEAQGIDVLFAPSIDEIYRGGSTIVRVEGLRDKWEGKHRPGHFDGVATIVCKLFNIVRPNTAYFGKKDLQQCAVISQMVHDLDMPVHLEFCETIREADGLAMSSRNRYLSPAERESARLISRELFQLREALPGIDRASDLIDEARRKLEGGGVRVQYLALVDSRTFDPVDAASRDASIIFAGFVGKTRLIDNVQLL